MGGAGTGAGAPTAQLYEVLADARAAGFLGPGPIEQHVQHAEGFALTARQVAETGGPSPIVIDLGSGGGIPALVVAEVWPQVSMVLLEANGRRVSFLNLAVELLGLAGRVRVVHGRAEVCGRHQDLRSGFDGVMARSFGRPAVVAECAAPFLRVGGWLVVSEPPPERDEDSASDNRWPADALAQLGLEVTGPRRVGFEYQTLRQYAPCPEQFPRRNGVPAKRPLF